MIVRTAALLAIGLMLAGGKSDPLAGRTAGKPEQCLDLSRINGPQIVDQRTILYTQSGKRIWRTGPVGKCPALRAPATLIVDVYANRLCRNDRFRVVEPGAIIPSAWCRFDAFTPYDKP